MIITETNSQCKLHNGYTQTFQARVVKEPTFNGTVEVNVTGTNYKDGNDYAQVNQISKHLPDPRLGWAVFRKASLRCRLMSPERYYDEMLVEKSDGLHLDLGSGITLHHVCGVK